MPAVAVPIVFRSTARRLLSRPYYRSGRLTLPLGPTRRGPFTSFYRDWSPSVARASTAGRWQWNRGILPLYGLTDFNVPVEYVELPDIVEFTWDDPTPSYLPQISFGQVRGPGRYLTQGMPIPDAELQLTFPPGRGGPPLPPEENRRRRDDKIPGWYGAALSVINRTYGELDEYGDVISAVRASGGSPVGFLANIGFNEAVDRYYGSRAKYLRRHIYSQPFYRLPVGLDALSRLWRG